MLHKRLFFFWRSSGIDLQSTFLRHKSSSSGLQPLAFSRQPSSFTLIELLVVMLIIVILSGITFSVSKYANWRARKARADIELQKIRAALDEYRAVYGEYPIVGDPNHYPTCWPTDPGTSNNVPPMFRAVDLVNTTDDPFDAALVDMLTVNTNRVDLPGVEYLPLKTPVYVDYRLTYALKMRPESEGRPPFMDFPMQTACFIVWQRTTRESATVDWRGQVLGWTIMGDPVNRLKAVDPVYGYQWHYECDNGTTYTLRPWTNGSYDGPNGPFPAF